MQQAEAGRGGGAGGGGGVSRQDAVQTMSTYSWEENSHFSTPVKQMEGETRGLLGNCKQSNRLEYRDSR